MTPPFRADHVGSLLRPRDLKDAFRAHGAGTLPDEELREVLPAGKTVVLGLGTL